MSKKTVQPKKTPITFYALLGVVALVGGYVLYTVTRPAALVAVAVDPSAPPVEAKGYVYGNPDAPITITEFADFECPGCAQFAVLHAPDIKSRIVDAGAGQLPLLDFPLQHPPATPWRRTWPPPAPTIRASSGRCTTRSSSGSPTGTRRPRTIRARCSPATPRRSGST